VKNAHGGHGLADRGISMSDFSRTARSLDHLMSGTLWAGHNYPQVASPSPGWFMRLVLWLVAGTLADLSAWAQGSGGSISGRVVDALGGTVPGAVVTVKNQSTGDARALRTNEKGFYSFPNVASGRYDASVSHAGFGDFAKKNLLVNVGEELIVDFKLTVGTAADSVEVPSESLELSLASSTLSSVVTGPAARELPLNGRDWTLLAALEPGVHTIDAQTAISAGSNGREDRGWGTEMAIGGSRPQQNNYRLDGISINDFTGSGPGNVLGSVLGTDAIQEFSVVTGLASADYGKTSGGVINAVTRSGTNDFHGSAYEFLRNSAFDARNFFDGSQVAPFKRNQFGGTVGGPLRHNRTFFFFNYEGLRQDLSSTTITTVPSVAARTGQLVSGKVTVDPRVEPYLQLFPLPSGTVSGDTGIYSFVSAAASSVNFFTGRLDHIFSDRDSMHGSFLVANSRTTSPDATDFTITGQISQSRVASVEETHVFSSNLLNIFRAGMNRDISEAPISAGVVNPLATDTSLGYLPNTPVGGITITGLTVFNGGMGSAGQNDFHFTNWQLYDDVSYVHGAHVVQFGTSLERIESNEIGNSNPNGHFTFGSLQAFLTDQPENFTSTIPGESPTIYLRQFIPGFYIRDDYRVLSNLTLNLGLRYEMATVPTEKYDRLSNLDSLTAATPKLGSPYFQNPTLRDFSPRVGFAWDPFRSGKTAVRGGFGIYDTLPLTYQFELLAINEAPFFQTGSLTTLPPGSFPTGALSLLTPNSLGYAWVQPNPKRSYVEQWNLTVQRWLPGGVIATISESGQHGLHQPLRTSDANIVLPTETAQGLIWPVPRGSGARLNPNVGAINALAWLSSNRYESGNAAIAWERHGARIGAAYTFSRSIDDSSSSIAVANFNNSVDGSFIFDPSLARGLSDFDIRQNFVLNATWRLPRLASAHGFARWATDRWQVGGIFRAASGLPFTPVIGGDPLGLNNSAAFDFPDRLNLPGCNNPVNPGNATHYIKTQCFAAPQPATRLGDSGRNIAIGPGVNNVDVSLFKNNYIHNERVNIQFRVELFNVLNHTNFAVPTRTAAELFTQTFSPVTTAGLLTTTSTTSRQIQLALKCIF
jgi:hypothetical protein